jgi:hypothetical protein
MRHALVLSAWPGILFLLAQPACNPPSSAIDNTPGPRQEGPVLDRESDLPQAVEARLVSNGDYFLMIGNSMQYRGIDFPWLQVLVGRTVEEKREWGVMSSWKFAALWQAAHATQRPGYVIMVTRLNYLTNPLYRSSGEYAVMLDQIIDRNAELRAIVDSVLDMGKGILDAWDFANAVGKSFLPCMVEAADSAGMTLIIARHRSLEYAENPLWEGEKQRKYRDDLTDYLRDKGALFLDYTLNPELSVADYEPGGDHLWFCGRGKWTRQMGEDLCAIIAGNQAFNERTGFVSPAPPSILTPQTSQVIHRGVAEQLLGTGGQNCLWSYHIPGDGSGEIFLGRGDSAELRIGMGPSSSDSVVLFLLSDGEKTHQWHPVTGEGLDLPPTIDLVISDTLTVGETYELNPTATDDRLPAESLSVRWSTLSGFVTYGDPECLRTTASVRAMFTTVIRLTVSDGESTVYRDVRLNLKNPSTITIATPNRESIWHPGDSVTIVWAAEDVDNVALAISYDDGLTFKEFTETVQKGDAEWGNLLWQVPRDAPETNGCRVRVSDYSGPASAVTEAFTVRLASLSVRH